MLYRTLSEAQKPTSSVSWRQKVILKVTLRDGRTFYRTYEFDRYQHQCKRCRKARSPQGDYRRLACTGHVCEICGNPFAGFTRQWVRHDGPGQYRVLHNCWGGGGRLH